MRSTVIMSRVSAHIVVICSKYHTTMSPCFPMFTKTGEISYTYREYMLRALTWGINSPAAYACSSNTSNCPCQFPSFFIDISNNSYRLCMRFTPEHLFHERYSFSVYDRGCVWRWKQMVRSIERSLTVRLHSSPHVRRAQVSTDLPGVHGMRCQHVSYSVGKPRTSLAQCQFRMRSCFLPPAR